MVRAQLETLETYISSYKKGHNRSLLNHERKIHPVYFVKNMLDHLCILNVNICFWPPNFYSKCQLDLPGKMSDLSLMTNARFLQSLYLLKHHHSTFDSKLMFILESKSFLMICYTHSAIHHNTKEKICCYFSFIVPLCKILRHSGIHVNYLVQFIILIVMMLICIGNKSIHFEKCNAEAF